MQKKLIALAITAAFASAPAFADVTVYGKLDAGLGNVSTNAIAKTTGVDGPKTSTTAIGFSQFFTSRVGVKAKEDLGNGMNVAAVVETGLPGGALGNREMNLALGLGEGTTIKGGFGTTTLRNIAYGYDAIWGANLIGNLMNDTVHKNGLSSELTKRSTYVEVGHNFGAVTATADVMVNNTTIDNVTPDTKTGSGFELGAQYAAGPLSVGGAYRNTKDSNPLTTATTTNTVPTVVATTNASDKTNKAFILGASYDFGVAMVKAQYANVTVDDNLASTSVKNSGESIGVDVPFTSALTGFAQSSFAKNTTTDQKSTGYAVGVKYDMSKSTFAYADVGGTKFDSNANGAGLKATQYTIGLVNSF